MTGVSQVQTVLLASNDTNSNNDCGCDACFSLDRPEHRVNYVVLFMKAIHVFCLKGSTTQGLAGSVPEVSDR